MSDFFKVRCVGQDDGSYLLSYGKGKKKLTRVATKVGQKFCVEGYEPATLKTTKEVWGKWAASQYGGTPVVHDDDKVITHSEPTPGTPRFQLQWGGPPSLYKMHGFNKSGQRIVWHLYNEESDAGATISMSQSAAADLLERLTLFLQH